MSGPSKPRRAERMATPVGEVKFAFIDKPSTTFNPDGEYVLNIRINKTDAAAFMSRLQKLDADSFKAALDAETNMAKRKQMQTWAMHFPITEEMDEVTGDPTGYFILKAKRHAVVKLKDGRTINTTVPLYDCSSPPKQVTGVKMGKGSKVRAAIEAVPYAAAGLMKHGVSLRLVGVQIVELVEYTGGSSPESMGFSGDASGYTADSTDGDTAPFESTSDTVGGSSNPNF